MKLKVIITTLLLTITTACIENNNKQPNVYDAGTPLTKLTKPVMSINGQVLSQEDFFAFAGNILREIDALDANNQLIKDKLVNDFTEHYVLLQEAALQDVKIDDKRINDVLSSFNTREGSQDLRVYTGTYSMDRQELTKLIEERLIIETLLNSIINNDISVTDTEVKEYYNANKANYTIPRRAHVMHIFTTDKAIADKAMAALRRGISCSEVAERDSEGPERADGGDLGFVNRDNLPDFFSEAFKLRVNRRSPIIKSDYGYHIFLVRKYENAQNLPLDKVTSQITQELYTKKQEQLTREYIDELMENAIIKNIDAIDFTAFEHLGSSTFGSN